MLLCKFYRSGFSFTRIIVWNPSSKTIFQSLNLMNACNLKNIFGHPHQRKCPVNLALSVRSSVRLFFRNSQFSFVVVVVVVLFCFSFSDFLHEVRETKWKKWRIRALEKKVWTCQKAPRSPKNGPKIRFLGYWQKSNLFIYTFLPQYENTNGLLSSKTTCLGKMRFLSYPKTFRPIRMHDSLNCNISQTRWEMKVNFCTRLDVHRSNKFSRSLQVGVVRHAWACSKWWKIVNSISRTNWVMKLVFVCE